MAPTAPNFNIVPAVLLELKGQNGLIKARRPAALLFSVVNIILSYLSVFRF
ncbi:DUF979 family protein [Paraburkholderia madseniana]|jgi:uncharacterized membrane protein|uniref:DUF979 domain-containing protein n=1 Tax=Paraburkholderia madseniana TaxID=2599607 RepID=A0AAP5BJB6_9BURK|nr:MULTISPECIES: DUF979 family protein [Paraburkholderia]MCX4149777.1 DUF979 family protein [Paraburkholderia madseniana]MCX4175097.1 DUF979 family protein [Paraburkholderia madseniana]MDN7152713.1 DUF979 domain-containing protein [Paraburkholderia sp. WS6]MDQ6411595.1 DUF979 domain-containing protein [Paraburkholderia madseniana]MDQ6463097.1 DUF979 domain-containing protein [Paraburkholderia madseniana]